MTKAADGHQHDRKNAEVPPAQVRDIGRSLLHALRNTGIAVLYQDRDLRILWAQNLPEAWTTANVTGKTDADFLPPSLAEHLRTAKRAVIDTGEPESLEISVPQTGGARWFEVWMDADKNGDGHALGVVTTAVDITEQKRREQTLKALLRELSHRSKNLLAIIQSIATQTGRYSGSIETFLARFRGRLQSLASSQDLVTSSNWRGADLRELVMSQVGRYSADAKHMVVFEGTTRYLNPNAALHIGLALHELAVNSMSYGALMRADGSVTVSANLIHDAQGQPALSLTWMENIQHDRHRTADAKRFGSVALERVVPTSLDGSASLTITDDTLRYELVVPGASFEVD
ncbi:PAS domain S-box-containing protein [Pseudaminobacter salicylatoxidans]|uniref:Blue-light-activated histidine kinase n=1 Tax=Pseudaminobacter salicylatoxidans TaxID=93369 RepID=A0A316C5F1_PSESE|nr:HWE histidine kinase domain-containing protein [Pseudaminobacter salicylatoxidans]PWJ84921.1 PAS domain S-box-containing protein [Pseudaminobacter salicylatoxidans]